MVVRIALGVASAENQLASLLTLCLANIILDAPLVVRAIIVTGAAQLLNANVVVAVLVLGTTRVALAGGLTETVNAELVAYAVPCATAERCKMHINLINCLPRSRQTKFS